MWSRQSTSVSDERLWPFRAALEAARVAQGRRGIIKLLGDKPDIRQRTSGPVRLCDGVDYSIRYADIGGKFSFQKELPWLLHIVAGYSDIPTRLELCKHNHIELITLSDEGCRQWTVEAEKRGVRFQGKWGYTFPTAKSIHKYRKLDFKSAKEQGNVPCAVRSADARQRRAEKRRCKKPVLRKGWTPLSPSEPLQVRPSRSAASIRRAWYPLRSSVRFSTFKEQNVSPVLALWIGPSSPAPKPVIDAVNRIYSRPVVYERKGELTFPDTRPRDVKQIHVPWISGPTPDPKSHAVALKNRLDSWLLTDDASVRGYWWFYWNRALEKYLHRYKDQEWSKSFWDYSPGEYG